MHGFLVSIRDFSPYIWLFGSLFGVFMSGKLALYAYNQKVMGTLGIEPATSNFWFRHALWFFTLHVSYVLVGILTVANIESDWSDLLILLILLSTPLVLVYRSFDSLRVNSHILRTRNGKRNERNERHD